MESTSLNILKGIFVSLHIAQGQVFIYLWIYEIHLAIFFLQYCVNYKQGSMFLDSDDPSLILSENLGAI